ncbi:MAG: phage portal protein [Pseudomonadota bacterium]
MKTITRRSLRVSGRRSQISRDAGTYRGTLSQWRVPKNFHRDSVAHERVVIQDRASDLYVNDWAARSVVNTLVSNVIGTGLTPQSRLPWRLLGITREEAREISTQIEWLWYEWCENCHAKGKLSFSELQRMGFRSVLRDGEMLHVPVANATDTRRRFALTIQDVAPERLSTPADCLGSPYVRDGIEINDAGQPTYYYIATPSTTLDFVDMRTLTSSSYTRVPAWIAHRRGCFHLFLQEDEEQIRGVSVLSPAMKLFRHLTDAITHELYGQVAAASMPMVVETESPTVALPGYVETMTDRNGEKMYHQNVEAGTLLYLNENERIKSVESSRPSPNFLNFCELILRAVSASVDLPYEAVLKDFSKTNYSSARAALLEAWRVYMTYRDWFVGAYCKPIFSMVMEEAYLRGLLVLPQGSADFYENLKLWTNATWIGPARGYVDPVKEVNANILAHDAGFKTLTEIISEQGQDFEDVMDTREQEAERLQRLQKLTASSSVGSPVGDPVGSGSPSATPDAPDDDNNDDDTDDGEKEGKD